MIINKLKNPRVLSYHLYFLASNFNPNLLQNVFQNTFWQLAHTNNKLNSESNFQIYSNHTQITNYFTKPTTGTKFHLLHAMAMGFVVPDANLLTLVSALLDQQ